MPLVKNSQVVPDAFVRVADDAALPDGVPVIVSAARLLAEAGALRARTAPMGVLWPNDRKVEELAPHLAWLAVVGLTFPKFRDGRAYSQARLVRERYGYRGELRATGQVLRDQFLFMLRAGFDAFEVTKDADALAFPEAARRYSVFFQPAADGVRTVAGARMRGQHAPLAADRKQATEPVS
jgi:uncharacterized protein (DUF934 family)